MFAVVFGRINLFVKNLNLLRKLLNLRVVSSLFIMPHPLKIRYSFLLSSTYVCVFGQFNYQQMNNKIEIHIVMSCYTTV